MYNTLHGTNYSERDAEITINTLGESLFTPQKNDLWDMVTALEVEREEGFEKGREEIARNMLRDGFSYEQTARLSMLDIEKIKKLSYTIQA